MRRGSYTLAETDAIRAAGRTETVEAVAVRFGRGVTIVRRIAGLGQRKVGVA